MENFPHGTDAGIQMHEAFGTPLCAACKAARAERAAAWRKGKGQESVRRTAARMRLRNRAMRVLARRHPEELQAIMDQLEKEEGRQSG